MTGRTRLVVAALLVAAGCKGAEPPKQPLGAAGTPGGPDAGQPVNPQSMLTPAARAALDSGNLLFRAGLYDRALTQYRVAAKEVPLNAAPYIGIYMVAQKLNNTKLADSALKAVQAREGAMSQMFTDSTLKKAHLQGGAAKKNP